MTVRRATVFLIVLLACGIAVTTALRQPSAARVQMGFYGWTNANGEWQALFGITNPPILAVDLQSIHRISNAPPIFMKFGAGSDLSSTLGTWRFARREPWGMTIGVALFRTDEPLLCVFQFQERASGAARVPEICRELWGKMTGNERSFFTGSKFLVTNRTERTMNQ